MSTGIVLIGLGITPEDLTISAGTLLEKAQEVVLLDALPPAYKAFDAMDRFRTLEDISKEQGLEEGTDDAGANLLLKLGIRPEGVVIALSGDPTCNNALIASLRKKAEGVSIPVKILPAAGCLQHCLALSGVNAAEGLFQMRADRLEGIHHPPFSPDTYAFLEHLPAGEKLQDLVDMLTNQYPGSFRVSVYLQDNMGIYTRREMALDAVPEEDEVNGYQAMLIPPMKQESSLERFQETIAHLRAEDGCPWDRKQTHQTLRLHLLEETYEALDALDRGDLHSLREELGDLLLQIVLHAQIGTENGSFRMTDVIAGIQTKIIHRHPHVFSDTAVQNVDDVLTNWEALKKSERKSKGSDESLLNGVPRNLPALAQAVEIQDRAARVGFEWDAIEGVLDKIQEEVGEIRAAETREERAAEFGDLLFVLSNFARWLDIEPESALREASARFRARFTALEQTVLERGLELSDLSLAEMDAIWDQVKRDE